MTIDTSNLWDLFEQYKVLVDDKTRTESIDYDILSTLAETASDIETLQNKHSKLLAKYNHLVNAFKEIE